MSRKQLLIFGMVVVVVIIIVWGVFAVLGSFDQYRQSVLSPPPPEIFVQLIAPTKDQQGAAGVPVHLAANAYGSLPIESITFWINNVPVSLQQAPGEASLMANAFFPWVPTETGSYAIFARVVAEGGISADSDLVYFQVFTGNSPVDPQPLAPDPAYNGPLPGGTGGGGDAQPWSGSLGGWLSPSSDEALPNPPGLSASVNGCEVTLSFSDNSDNETGFRVYRSLPNIPGWSLAETLAANDGAAGLTFTEDGYHGTLGYKVAAFNAQGEAVSNPVSVEVAPQDCPGVDLPILSLQMVELQPLVPVDLAYCYFSLDEVQWNRWPNEGFMQVGDDGTLIPKSSLLSLLLPQYSDAGQTPDHTIHMDCWGWLGAELVDLGRFSVEDIGPASPGSFPFDSDFLQGILEYRQTNTMDGSIFGDEYGLFMPIPVLSHSDSVYDCLDRLDTGANVPYNYCLEADGETPWPFMPSYITWELTDNCQMSPICFDFLDPQAMNDPLLVNAEIGYRVRDEFGQLVRTFTRPTHRVFMVPGVAGYYACREPLNLRYRVSSYMIPEGSQTVFESDDYWFVVPEPCPAVSGAIINVTAEMLFVGNPVEEANEGQFLDLYGIVIIHTSGMNAMKIIQFGAYDEQIKPGCPIPDSPNEAGGAAYNGQCPIANGWGVDLAQAYVCPEAGFSGCFSSFSPGGNTVEMSILEGESLTIWLSVYDYDANSADDEVCHGSVTLPAWVLDDWQNMVNATDELVLAFGENGSCVLHFDVQELVQFTN